MGFREAQQRTNATAVDPTAGSLCRLTLEKCGSHWEGVDVALSQIQFCHGFQRDPAFDLGPGRCTDTVVPPVCLHVCAVCMGVFMEGVSRHWADPVDSRLGSNTGTGALCGSVRPFTFLVKKSQKNTSPDYQCIFQKCRCLFSRLPVPVTGDLEQSQRSRQPKRDRAKATACAGTVTLPITW